MDFFTSSVADEEIKREKAKARVLRNSTWWKRKRSEGICYFCMKKIAPAELTMDHVVPLIRGGKSVKGNIVAACKDCNNKKKHMLPLEWEEYMERLKTEEE